ncbi:MAG: hypothetical protein EOP62_11340 [Sphingomonadales bacterium]|nr:MAG: hypothetical protein EOP62_11340 [Sphingomonadales bacterium]
MKHSQHIARIIAITGLAASALALSGAMHIQPPTAPVTRAPVQNCHAAQSGVDRGRFRGPTEQAAKSAWNFSVVASVGPSYAKWNKARNADVTCGHDGKRLKTWTCTATAEPCDDGPPNPTPTPTPTPQPACYPSISIEGADTKLQSGAQTQSIHAWRGQVAQYGAIYQDWNKAQGKDITCRHNGLGPLQRRWRCVATGKPCK